MVQRLLQVHVPRTGGTSIRHAFQIDDPPHLTAEELRQHVGEATWQSGYRFTVVRNPFDRLVSIYFYYWHHRKPRKRRLFRELGLTFAQWLLEFDREERRNTPSFSDQNYLPFTDWIDVAGGLDWIGRFENYEETWRKLCEVVGRNIPQQRLLPTKHGPYRQYYTPDLRQIVERRFECDLINFGYNF